MLKNYLLIGIRNIKKNFFISLINIFGLSTGFACFLIITFWIKNEMSYDKFNNNSENIYKVLAYNDRNEKFVFGGMVNPLTDRFVNDMPEVNSSVILLENVDNIFSVDDKIFTEKKGIYASNKFLDFFTYEFKYKKNNTQPISLDKIVLTENTAFKYFGDINPIGKSILINNDKEYIVSGVLKSIPENSHLQFNYILPIEPYLKERGHYENWDTWFYQIYISVNDNINFASFKDKITDFVKVYQPDFNVQLDLLPLEEIHLYSRNYGARSSSDIRIVRVLFLIGLITLIVAIINFINLTIARSSGRIKEIGIRKTIGSDRKMMIQQFLSESFIYVLSAVLLSHLLIMIFTPLIHEYLGISISFNYLQLDSLIILFAAVLFTVALAGGYPSLVLSRLKPANILRNYNALRGITNPLNKALVIIQVSFSVILLVVGIMFFNQIDYMNSKNLGYEKDEVIIIPRRESLKNNYNFIKNRLLQNPAIKAVTSVRELPSNTNMATPSFDWVGKSDEIIFFNIAMVESNFINSMGIELIEGRGFSSHNPADTNNYIINETAAKLINKSSVIGLNATQWGEEGKIIGIVKDFHFKSIHNEITPLVFRLSNFDGWMLIKYADNSTEEVIASIRNIFTELDLNLPFEYSFLENELTKEYEKDYRISFIIKSFILVSLLISFLGMLGLASYTIEKRMKEIGIRKVLGATINSLFILMSWHFIKLIIIANIISIPLAYFISKAVLQNYAYRVNISFNGFLLATVISFVVTLLSTGYYSLKASSVNPIKFLNIE